MSLRISLVSEIELWENNQINIHYLYPSKYSHYKGAIVDRGIQV